MVFDHILVSEERRVAADADVQLAGALIVGFDWVELLICAVAKQTVFAGEASLVSLGLGRVGHVDFEIIHPCKTTLVHCFELLILRCHVARIKSQRVIFSLNAGQVSDHP